MRHGSLFSGIGGFDLAAEWMRWENVFHCEWNPFGQKVLNHYWPEAETFTDITKSDFTKYNGTIDIISGGFPCQPYSQAGKRKGKEDERHLWPEMLRAIREIQPGYVVGENVRGLTNWNGGMVFDEVQADLEYEGYKVLPFLLPACAVDAPHRRDRIWFIAHSQGYGNRGRLHGMEGANGSNGQSEEHREDDLQYRNDGKKRNAADTKAVRMERSGSLGQQITGTHGRTKLPMRNSSKRDWSDWPTQSPLCSRNDGLSTELSGITFSKHRNESIKAYGNAVVPQIPFEIFKAIQQYENL